MDFLLLCPFYRWVKWVLERLGTISRVQSWGLTCNFVVCSRYQCPTIYHFPWGSNHSDQRVYSYKALQRWSEYLPPFFKFNTFKFTLNLMSLLSGDVLTAIHQRAVWGRVCFSSPVGLMRVPAALPGDPELKSPPSFLWFFFVLFFHCKMLRDASAFQSTVKSTKPCESVETMLDEIPGL